MKVYMSIRGNPVKIATYLESLGFQHDGSPMYFSGVVLVDTDRMTVGSCPTSDHPLTTLDELKEIMHRPWLEKQLVARTLQLSKLGYQDRGGVYMAPPFGKTPDYILEEMEQMKSTHYIKIGESPSTISELRSFFLGAGFKELPNNRPLPPRALVVRIAERTFQIVGDLLESTEYSNISDILDILDPPTTLEQALEAYKAGKTVNVQLRAYSYILDDDVRLGHLIDPDARFGIVERKTFTQILNGMNTVSHALENGTQSTDFPMKEIIDAAIDELIRLNALVENSAP